MPGGGLLEPFLGALQASLSVLLTISYGVVATQFKLINDKTAKDISKLCVRLLLPALLITNIGSQLSSDTIGRYIPIFIWAIVHNCVSIAIGVAATKGFKLPSWVTPAIAFNNTTALPLLLIQALDSTGILKSLLASSDDSTSEAVQRAKSYFLVNSVVGSCITFAIGPQLLNAHEEDAPDKEEKEDDDDESASDEENGADDNFDDAEEEDSPRAQEEDSLLPAFAVRSRNKLARKANSRGAQLWSTFPPWVQKTLTFTYQFINAPVIGAAIGLFLGLIPPLHRAFFNDMGEGGIFNAWLMASIKNIGELFAALQVLVVGVKLSNALKAMKAGKGEEEAGSIPWGAAVFVEVVRFVVWPAISIPLVWAVATKTNALSQDPMLWFCMMLMPTGPPALKLSALADCNGSSDREKMSIAKFLTLSYVISPLIAFAVVGSLKATQAAME